MKVKCVLRKIWWDFISSDEPINLPMVLVIGIGISLCIILWPLYTALILCIIGIGAILYCIVAYTRSVS